MSVTYTSSTTSYGPDRPSVTTLALGVPTAPPAIIDNTITNTNRSTMAVQVDLDTLEGPQQGLVALTNVTSATLTGYKPGQLSFVQSVGAYQPA